MNVTKSIGLIAGAIALTIGVAIPMGAKSPAKPTSLTCTVELIYEFRAQDGTLQQTETYVQDFQVAEGQDFVDDYSTVTRFKQFSANVSRVGRENVLAVSWFSDVSVFNSVDFNTDLILPTNQNRGRLSGSQRFSSTPGHSTVFWTVLATKN